MPKDKKNDGLTEAFTLFAPSLSDCLFSFVVPSVRMIQNSRLFFCFGRDPIRPGFDRLLSNPTLTTALEHNQSQTFTEGDDACIFLDCYPKNFTL